MLGTAPAALPQHDHLDTEKCEIFLKRQLLLSKLLTFPCRCNKNLLQTIYLNIWQEFFLINNLIVGIDLSLHTALNVLYRHFLVENLRFWKGGCFKCRVIFRVITIFTETASNKKLSQSKVGSRRWKYSWPEGQESINKTVHCKLTDCAVLTSCTHGSLTGTSKDTPWYTDRLASRLQSHHPVCT
jgi:hypothetical protein